MVSALLTWAAGYLFELNVSRLWPAAVILNVALSVLDGRVLVKAGHDVDRWWCFVVPVYLFKRAKQLGQQPWYAATWLIVLLASTIIIPSPDYSVGTVTSYDGRLLQPGQAEDFSPDGRLTFRPEPATASSSQVVVAYEATAGQRPWHLSQARLELVGPASVTYDLTGGGLTDLSAGGHATGTLIFDTNHYRLAPGTYRLVYHCVTHRCAVGWQVPFK